MSFKILFSICNFILKNKNKYTKVHARHGFKTIINYLGMKLTYIYSPYSINKAKVYFLLINKLKNLKIFLEF